MCVHIHQVLNLLVFRCRKYVGQIYTDSLVHDDKALQFLVSVIGEVSLHACLVILYSAVCRYTQLDDSLGRCPTLVILHILLYITHVVVTSVTTDCEQHVIPFSLLTVTYATSNSDH